MRLIQVRLSHDRAGLGPESGCQGGQLGSVVRDLSFTWPQLWAEWD